MKVKNLLLAGLAVAAMTACSNNDEFVDNSQVLGAKDAFMQFGITMPQGTKTRATGDKEAGTDAEQNFADIAIVIDYGSTKELSIFPKVAFNEKIKGQLYLKESIPVQATANGQTAKIYAFVNPDATLKGNLADAVNTYAALKQGSNYDNTLDGLINGAAKENNFLMTGIKAGAKFVKDETATYTVEVDRVAAKLEERTSPEAAWTVTKDSEGNDLKNANGENISLSISVSDYSFSNLQTESYVLYNETPLSVAQFQPWAEATKSYQFKKCATVAGDVTGSITYCYENATSTTTSAVYKAVAKVKVGETVQEAANFFIAPDNTVFLSYADLTATYKDLGLAEKDSPEAYAAKGFMKYEGGVCYYKADIKTNTDVKIARNNVYKLTVTGIAKLGFATPGPKPKNTMLNLEVKIMEWTVNENNFNLGE